MQAILAHYAHLEGDGERAFRALCALLAEKSSALDWRGLDAPTWHLLGEMALGEGVAELAYYLLRTHPEAYRLPEFDPATNRRWAEREAATAVRNAILFKQLERVLAALGEIDVPVVLLKGADLARSIYPQPGLRSMSDLDLLVPRAQYAQALAQIKRLGFEEYHPVASLGLDALLSHNAYLRKAGRTATELELHWTLVGTPAFRYAPPIAWFWEHVEPRSAGGRVLALNPTAHLLYLAAHQMLQHGGESTSLRWLLDVHRLVTLRGQDIDWGLLADQAHALGWGGALRVCLELVQACFDTPLPEGLLGELLAQAGPFEALIAEKSAPAATHTLSMWKTLQALRWGGRLRLVLAMLFPGQAYLRWRYRPRWGWSWPLYHVVLWAYILCDGFRTLWILGYNRLRE